MRFFERFNLDTLPLNHRLLNGLKAVSEYKGKQALFKKQAPEKLEVLRQTAIVQSTESSNRIEQVTAEPGRLVDLMKEKTTPKNRSEQEIVGYRKALDRIHANHQHIPVNASTALLFHRDLFWYDELKAGKYKASNNSIVRKDGTTEEIIFEPVLPHMVPVEMDRLNQKYDEMKDLGWDPLMLIASYILDFLCIHPFRDGNGRVGRLLTLLLLYKHGFEVGAYISLEKIVEETKDSYYDTLNISSQGWHQNNHDALHWIEYFINVMILMAYKKFEMNLDSLEGTGTKGESVIEALYRLPKYFKFSDIERMCPHVSSATIKLTLDSLKKRRLVKCAKRGRDATWEKARTKFWVKDMPEDESSLFWGRFETDPFWSKDPTKKFYGRRRNEPDEPDEPDNPD